MEINDNRKREIAELAEYIANEYCPSTIVDPEIIARESGITFNYGEYGEAFDGLLEHESGDFHIYLNTDNIHTKGGKQPTVPHHAFRGFERAAQTVRIFLLERIKRRNTLCYILRYHERRHKQTCCSHKKHTRALQVAQGMCALQATRLICPHYFSRFPEGQKYV